MKATEKSSPALRAEEQEIKDRLRSVGYEIEELEASVVTLYDGAKISDAIGMINRKKADKRGLQTQLLDKQSALLAAERIEAHLEYDDIQSQLAQLLSAREEQREIFKKAEADWYGFNNRIERLRQDGRAALDRARKAQQAEEAATPSPVSGTSWIHAVGGN